MRVTIIEPGGTRETVSSLIIFVSALSIINVIFSSNIARFQKVQALLEFRQMETKNLEWRNHKIKKKKKERKKV